MEKSNIVIKKLSKKTLSGALEILDKVFGHNSEDKMLYTRGFNTSLGETKYLHLYPRGKPAYLYYFVAIDKKNNKIVGTTGLYSYPEDDKKGITWLGWYCVDPNYRNKGIGTKLLDFSIQKAKEMKKSKLRIWTVEDFNLKKSFEMYKRRCFKIIDSEERNDGKIYLELDLNNNFRLEPLSKNTLKQASNLALSIFDTSPEDSDYPPKWFKASLEQKKYKKLFDNIGCSYLQYYVALDSNKVVGLTGLYSLKKDEKEAYWLAWFFVSPKYRGKGVGSYLIDSMISKSKMAGKKYLRLYTSPNEAEKEAQEFYEKRGFKKTGSEFIEGYNRIYRELKL